MSPTSKPVKGFAIQLVGPFGEKRERIVEGVGARLDPSQDRAIALDLPTDIVARLDTKRPPNGDRHRRLRLAGNSVWIIQGR